MSYVIKKQNAKRIVIFDGKMFLLLENQEKT